MKPSNAAEPARPRSRPVQGLFIVGTALAVWWPAFTIGAWGTLFFDQLLTVWVISTAACLIVLVQPRPAHHRIRRAIALAVPSVWLFLSFFTDPGDDELLLIVDLLAIFIAVTGLPLTLWVMLKLFWPEAMGRMPRRLTVAAVVIVGGIAIGSFALGANHPLFLTCEDFAISGNSEPPGCVKAEAD